MNSYTFTRAATAIRAPLTLRWSVKGEYGFPVVSGEQVVVSDFSGGIVSFEDGRECWRYPREVDILIAGATVIGTGGKRLTELDLASGKVLRDVECPWGIASVGVEAFLPERHAFLAVRSVDEAEGIKVKELALVGLDDLKPLWSVSSRGGSNEVFGYSRTCGDGKVFVCKGST